MQYQLWSSRPIPPSSEEGISFLHGIAGVAGPADELISSKLLIPTTEAVYQVGTAMGLVGRHSRLLHGALRHLDQVIPTSTDLIRLKCWLSIAIS